MAFTGILGTPGARLGYIALGVSYLPGGTGAFDFGVHQLIADQIRVYFNKPLSSTALDSSNYILTSLAPPGTAVVPNIEEVIYFDEGPVSVILVLDQALTSGTSYSLEVNGVIAVDGDTVPPGGKNFTANVIDYPIAIGAWQSKRDAIDILFDRSVGPTSTAATFEIRNAALPGPGVVMAQLAWAGENIPETTLRIQLPPGMPAADAYEIDFAGVKDASLNEESSGTVPLTLVLRSAPPYSYAALRQLQITDAYVVNVNNDIGTTGTVRVYFNGPVLDSTTTINWAAYSSSVHLKIDGDNVVTTPNAITIPDLINLANEFKADFNKHIVQYGIHVNNDTTNAVITPDAFDITSAYTLINDVQAKYAAHLAQNNVHLYEDKLYNDITVYNVSGNFAFARAVMNSLKATYNNHILLDEYPMNFTYWWSTPINEVNEFCRLNIADRAYEIQGPYSLFADLHFTMTSHIPSVRLEASLTSEDGGSSTNPLDYTGGIIARPANAEAQEISTRVVPEIGTVTKFDRQMLLLGSDSIEILNSDGEALLSKPRLTTSLPAAIWAFNEVIRGYYWHRSIPVSAHQAADTSTINLNTFAILPLATAIARVNAFKTQINYHITSNVYHFHSDNDNEVVAPDATDEESLITLVENIQQACINHFTKTGPHYEPTNRLISAPVRDSLIMDMRLFTNEEEYSIIGRMQDTFHDNYSGEIDPNSLSRLKIGRTYYHNLNIGLNFIGLATRPSLASAIPKLALVVVGEDLKFETDTIEVFFSKPMSQTPINSSNLPITGGSLLAGEVTWADTYRASIQVRSMETISYTITANNLWDVAGNPIL